MSDILQEIEAARQAVQKWDMPPMPPGWKPKPAALRQGLIREPKYIPQEVPADAWETTEPRSSSMIRKFLALFAVLAFFASSSGTVVAATAPVVVLPPSRFVAMPDLSISQTLKRGDSGGSVTILQQVLVNSGWPTWVDGDFGPHTEKMVTLYQKANGLLVDGIAGPQTLGHLGIWSRQTNDAPLGNTVAPSTAVGPCSQWTGLAAEVGWPADRLEWLSVIMYRESRCDPSAYNGRNRDRSYGLLQVNTLGSLWGELQRRCGLSDPSQLHDARTNLACGYKLFQAYGTKPWRSTNY